MHFSRRKFLAGTSASLLAASFPVRRSIAQSPWNALSSTGAIPQARDPGTMALLTAAIEAARRAGATYADARFRVQQNEHWGFIMPYPGPSTRLECGIGVRALYNGYWGYAGVSGAITTDAAARLGQEATAQARTSAQGPVRRVDLASMPVAKGDWTNPIEIDPFSVAWDEKVDVIHGVASYFREQLNGASGSGGMYFTKQDKAFASTEGSSFVQTLYLTSLTYGVGVGRDWMTENTGYRRMDFVSAEAAGWEYVLQAPFEANAARMIQQAEDARRPVPVDVGRYDIVFDGRALARLIDENLGAATELDRAMTYTANTAGTSYLNAPIDMLGTYRIGSPLLTLTANRSMPLGAATVKWDDEGVEPDEALLIKEGILTDFQTTRESASWLAPYYEKIGKPVRSHGGMTSGAVRTAPQQGPHNLVLAPSAQNTSLADLCSGVKKGIAVLAGYSRADQQALNTESTGELVYEINNGKLGRVIEGAVLLARAPDFWKNLRGLGGAQTVSRPSSFRWRNDVAFHTISAPAALVNNVAVTTNARRTV